MNGETNDAGGADGDTLWHGRFDRGPDEVLLDYTVSLPFDKRLYADDLTGCRAHVRGLARCDIISTGERDAILAALDQVEDEMSSGTFLYAPSDEDIHTAIERRTTEIAGEAGAKLHTGRSRNDQVATAVRLWCKRELVGVARSVLAMQDVLLDRAVAAGDARMPAYTHLQRAMPVTVAHHLLAHGWSFARDIDRLLDTVRRLDVSPLGAGALAGSSLPLDPIATADDLGFGTVFDNSLDAVSDRDFIAEALFDLSMVAIHLSRLGEEVVLWASQEFGFLGLDDAYATGSSMMPQKKNPDIAELARGKAGRVVGALTGLLVTLKGLPLTYNRDLQEDKELLFDSVDQVKLGLAAMGGLIATATLNFDRMAEAADDPYAAATDLAELLVQRGVAFRDAHAIVGTIVRSALAGTAPLVDLVRADDRLGEAGVALLQPGASVRNRRTHGSGGPEAVALQIDRFRDRLTVDRGRLGS